MPTLHGIPLTPVTDPFLRKFLGTHSGVLTVDGVDFTVWPDDDGGAHLHGTESRDNPWSSGGHAWQHRELTIAPDGRVEAGGAVVGSVVGGRFLPR